MSRAELEGHHPVTTPQQRLHLRAVRLVDEDHHRVAGRQLVAAPVADAMEVGEQPGQRPRQLHHHADRYRVQRRVGGGGALERLHRRQRLRHRLHVDVGLGVVRVADEVEPHGEPQRGHGERRAQRGRHPGSRRASARRPREPHQRPGGDEDARPHQLEHAPRRLVMDDAVGDEGRPGVERERPHRRPRHQRGPRRGEQPEQRRRLVAREQLEPVVPGLLVTGPLHGARRPDGVGREEAGEAAGILAEAGVEQRQRRDTGGRHRQHPAQRRPGGGRRRLADPAPRQPPGAPGGERRRGVDHPHLLGGERAGDAEADLPHRQPARPRAPAAPAAQREQREEDERGLVDRPARRRARAPATGRGRAPPSTPPACPARRRKRWRARPRRRR